MAELLTTENLLALLALTGLEIVLGIDNVIFIAIITGKLEKSKQAAARQVGLMLAMLMRIGLLLTISWIMLLTDPLFSVVGIGISGRDLILIVGGLFLVGKATYEIHHKMEDASDPSRKVPATLTFAGAIIQIILIDLVFSLDSVITAVGMAESVVIMIIAIVISIAVMMVFAKAISDFIEEHPTFKILALSFILMIGVMLVAEGLGTHIEKGYIYFAMAFSLFVEFINMRVGRSAKG